MTDPCWKGPTEFPQKPTRRAHTDNATWIVWDMLVWFVKTVFDPFAECVGAAADAIRFNVDNEGGWLYIVTNDATDISYGLTGLLLADTTSKGVQIVAQDAGNTKQATGHFTPDEINLGLTSNGARLVLDRSSGVGKLEKGGASLQVDANGETGFLTETTLKFAVNVSVFLPITAVNQGTKKFTVAGDYTLLFPGGAIILVSGSTGNDGNYTVVSSTLAAGNTVVTVVQAIPSAVANGTLIPPAKNVFEVRPDGTVHILTGSAPIADL